MIHRLNILVFVIQARWLGFDNKLHYYWGGTGGKEGYCACGMNSTCKTPEVYCNCDTDKKSYKRNQFFLDEGYLTIKDHLPVRRLDFLDFDTTKGHYAIYKLGPLQCWAAGELLFH